MLSPSHGRGELRSWLGYSRRTMMAALVATFLVVSAMAVSAQSPPPVHNTPAAGPSSTEAEVILPTPTHWFSDDVKATSPIFASEMDRRLERFEHETTNQFIVVILPTMQSGAAVNDYCRRVFNAWGIGQKGINNGVILFVFVQDHKLWIQVGRGLETSLTNPICQEIAKAIAAAFHRGDYEGGITTGVDAIVKILQTQPRPQGTPH